MTKDGKLTQSAIDKAKPIELKDGIQNPKIIKQLTADGSNIRDWEKMYTRSISGPNGKRIRVHFYQNLKTGKIDYMTKDFKVKDPIPAIPAKAQK